MLALSALAPTGASAKDATLPPLDPNVELTDQKLNPAIGKILSDAIVSYNAGEYRAAEKKIDEARAVPSPTPYDTVQIETLSGLMELREGHFDEALQSFESLAANPAIPQAARQAVYDGCLGTNWHQRNYWRAIQFGRLMEREHLLDAAIGFQFASTYYDDGLYAEAERTAQTALASGAADPDTAKKLQDLVVRSQEKTGERPQDKGEQLGKTLVGGFLGAFASGLTGQNIAAPDMGVRTQDQARAEAQTDAAAAGQRAAADSLAADPAAERVVYADLLETAVHLSPKDKKRASVYFGAASGAYGKNNYAAAAENLRNTLAIDPTNAAANYYYADCLARLNRDPIDIVDYLTRAVLFGAEDENANMAKTALQGLATPSAG